MYKIYMVRFRKIMNLQAFERIHIFKMIHKYFVS